MLALVFGGFKFIVFKVFVMMGSDFFIVFVPVLIKRTYFVKILSANQRNNISFVCRKYALN